jgi:hypothetical protein
MDWKLNPAQTWAMLAIMWVSMWILVAKTTKRVGKPSKTQSIRDMLTNLQPVGVSDTPIYDQLERDWAKKRTNW